MAAAKLTPRWTLVQVVRREGQASYVVRLSGSRERAVHESQLKPYVKDCFGKPTQLLYRHQDAEDAVGEPDEYDVETVLRHRKLSAKRGLEFLVKWHGYPMDEATW